MDKKIKKGVNIKANILLVVAIVLFVATLIRISFALYSDKKSFVGNLTFGNVELNVTGGVVEESKILNFSIIRNGETLTSGKVYPGDKVRVSVNISIAERTDPVYYLMTLTDTKNIFENACYFKDGDDVYVINDSGTFKNDDRTTQISNKYVGKINSSDESHEIIIDNEIINPDLLNEENNKTTLNCNIYAIQQANLLDTEAYSELSSKAGIVGAYTKADCIEATGTQYIDTGVKISPTVTDWNVETSIMWTDTSTRQLMGYNAGAGYFGIANSSDYEIATVGVGVAPSTTNFDKIVWGLSNNKYSINVNGTEKEKTKDSQGGTILLFALNKSLGFPCKVKMEYCKISTDGVLVRDFVPVVRNSDGKAGMYDIITKKFYTNSASGDDLICHGGDAIINGTTSQDGTPSPDSPKTLSYVGTLITSSNASSFGADSSKVGKFAVKISDNKYLYLDEPLRSVKNSSGDVISDELNVITKTVTRRVVAYKLLGTNDFGYAGSLSYSTNKDTLGIYISSSEKFGKYKLDDNGKDVGVKYVKGGYGACSHFKIITSNAYTGSEEGLSTNSFSASPPYIGIRIKKDKLSEESVNAFKQWFANENAAGRTVEIYLARMTPLIEQY